MSKYVSTCACHDAALCKFGQDVGFELHLLVDSSSQNALYARFRLDCEEKKKAKPCGNVRLETLTKKKTIRTAGEEDSVARIAWD